MRTDLARPEDVARAGFEAMMDGKERVVAASLSTKLQGRASRFLPDSAKAEMHRRMAEPGSANSKARSVRRRTYPAGSLEAGAETEL